MAPHLPAKLHLSAEYTKYQGRFFVKSASQRQSTSQRKPPAAALSRHLFWRFTAYLLLLQTEQNKEANEISSSIRHPWLAAGARQGLGLWPRSTVRHDSPHGRHPQLRPPQRCAARPRRTRNRRPAQCLGRPHRGGARQLRLRGGPDAAPLPHHADLHAARGRGAEDPAHPRPRL